LPRLRVDLVQARTLPIPSPSGPSSTGQIAQAGRFLRPASSGAIAGRLGERLHATPAARHVLGGLLVLSGSDEQPVRDPDPDKAADHEEHDR
jgi:hypothetical protein